MAESKSAALPLGYAPMLCLRMIFFENRLPPSDQVRGQAFSGSCAPEEAAPKHEFARAARTIAAARRPINARTSPLYGISAAFSGLR